MYNEKHKEAVQRYRIKHAEKNKEYNNDYFKNVFYKQNKERLNAKRAHLYRVKKEFEIYRLILL